MSEPVAESVPAPVTETKEEPVVETTAAETVAVPADEAAAPSDDKTAQKAAILKQVEFYFSDSNLPHDKFMSELTKKNDGWVPISLISSFKRMRDYNKELIPDALRESAELLEVSEDGQNVRRKTAVASKEEDHFSRSIYAKGFPEETPSLQLELEEYFGKLGNCKSVRFRRHAETKKFKGSVFVEYSSVEEANKIGSSKLEYDSKELLVMTKEAYCTMKAKQLGLDPNDIVRRNTPRGFGGGKFEKKRKNEDEKPETAEDMKNKVIRMKGVKAGEGQGSGLKDLKDKLKAVFRFGYLHWPRESDVADVQVTAEDKDAAKVIEELKEASFEFNGVKPEYSILNDEETEKFFKEKKDWEQAMANRESNQGGRRGGRGGHKGKGNKGRHDRKKIRTD